MNFQVRINGEGKLMMYGLVSRPRETLIGHRVNATSNDPID